MRENVNVSLRVSSAGVSRLVFVNCILQRRSSFEATTLPPLPPTTFPITRTIAANPTRTAAWKSLGEVGLHTLSHLERHVLAISHRIRRKRASTPRRYRFAFFTVCRFETAGGFANIRRAFSHSTRERGSSHIFAPIGASAEFRGRLQSVVVVPGFMRFGSPERKMSGGKHGAVSTAAACTAREREKPTRARWQGASELSRSNERARITRPCGNTNAVSTNTDSR